MLLTLEFSDDARELAGRVPGVGESREEGPGAERTTSTAWSMRLPSTGASRSSERIASPLSLRAVPTASAHTCTSIASLLLSASRAAASTRRERWLHQRWL